MNATPFEAIARVERDLVRGAGRFVDDIHLDGEVHGFVLRSPHAHARLDGIDATRARSSPGVLLVMAAADIEKEVSPLPCAVPLTSFGGKARAEADRAVLAVDRVRHLGDGVAFVVAQTLAEAVAAAELIEVEYGLLPVSARPGDPVIEPIWPDAPDNLCFEWHYGDGGACRQLFAEAAHVVRISLAMPRLVVNPIETRAAIGLYDPDSDIMTLISNTQGVHFVRSILAQSFGRAPESIRVLTPNIGGAFGSKIYAYPEHALVLSAARRVGRPVRWTSTRLEAIQSDTQGRGHVTEAALALDRDGRFLAISVRPTVDLGGYLSQLTPLVATGVGAPVQGGAYRFKAIEIVVRGVFTNKVPVDAFRGAGRPEATYVLERMIDRAAGELGVDPAELRARNLPESQSESLMAVTGLVVEGGRFLDNQRRCLVAADRAAFASRREESARRGRLRGFGFANYLEANGGLQVAEAVQAGSFPHECAALQFGPDGALDITIGTQSSGQDHAVPMQLYASERLGVDRARITVREGDSNALVAGSGTGGSKSLLTSSEALVRAINDVAARGKSHLAKVWKVDVTSIEFESGTFFVPDAAYSVDVRSFVGLYPGVLDGQSEAALQQGSCANGCHACEVEIDVETGRVDVVRYTAVDDFGRVVNRSAVLGQVQGGVMQGISQALWERAPSVEELAGSLERGWHGSQLPRAAAGVNVDWHDNGLPNASNVLGAKACGESGIAASAPTVMNAIANALEGFALARTLQMPARPGDVWRVIQGGRL